MSKTSFLSKLKPTKVDDMRQVMVEEEQYTPTTSRDGHKLDNGVNKFRFYPGHEGEANFFKQFGSHWGKVDGEGGEGVARKVPDGKMHGGLSVDPIEGYISLVQARLDGANEAHVKVLNALTNNKSGLQNKIKWAAWADKIVDGKPIFDLFEFTKTVREAIRKESIIDDPEEAMEVEPFTDPVEGKCLIINYFAAAKKGNQYYKDGIMLAKKPLPLTEEQAEHFVTKVKPLSQLKMFQYTEKDFETALEIVKYFDEEHEVNLFDDDEYQDLIVKLRKEMKKNAGGAATTSVKPAAKKKTDDDDDEEEVKKPAPKKAVKVEEEEDDTEEVVKKPVKKADKFDAMDRDALKEFIAEEELEITVKKSHSDEDIRNNIRTFLSEQVVDTKKAVKVEEEEDDTETKTTPKKRPDLGAIKDKLRN